MGHETSEPVTGSKTIADTATYTWIAKGDAAAWNGAANWSCDKSTGIGCPTETSTAKFTAADGADVTLDQNRKVKTLTIDAGARVVFSGPFTFTPPANSGSDFQLGASDAVFGAKHGATIRYPGTFSLNCARTTLLLDNAKLHVNHFKTDVNNVNTTGNTLVLAGAAPEFRTQGWFGANNKGYDFTVKLVVPQNGWATPVIVADGVTEKKAFAAANNAAGGKIVFTVEATSPFLNDGKTKKMKLIDSPNGFDVAHLDLEPTYNPTRARTCKLALNNPDDPAKASLLILTLRGSGGFTFMFR